MHARHLCRDYDVLVSPQRHYGVGYHEPQIEDREKLLEESIKDAMERWFKNISSPHNKIFFIEDTSVIIKALSKEKEVPGVDIKYWMKEHDFSSIDKMLKEAGSDRRVEVRSDLILCLPQKNVAGKREYITHRFTSSTVGFITSQEYAFETNLLYPWLDNKSFNKWFIPDSCDRPISMLPISEADKYDFRAGAFKKMLAFLENKSLINRKRKKTTGTLHLTLQKKPLFIVCGLPCSGKTTLGIHLACNCGYYHIEASDFMHLSYYQRHGSSTSDLGSFAALALKEMPSIVVDQIIAHIDEIGDLPLIITGFRSLREIETFKENYSGSHSIEVIYIDADQQKRFERNVNRGRHDKVSTRDDFTIRDEQQLKMGLMQIKLELKDKTITNNGTVQEYLDSVMLKYKLNRESNRSISYRTLNLKKPRLENAILLSLVSQLNNQDEYLTTTEIAHLVNKVFDGDKTETNKNNVSRYFNQDFYPYYEIKTEKGKNKFRLSQTGISKAIFINSDYR